MSVHSYLPESEFVLFRAEALGDVHESRQLDLSGPSSVFGLTMLELVSMPVPALNELVRELGLNKRSVSAERRLLKSR